jgi:hypothetical protein
MNFTVSYKRRRVQTRTEPTAYSQQPLLTYAPTRGSSLRPL